MQNRLVQQLEKAKNFCHQGEFYQAYNIFKRYYDRLPFALDEAHVELITYFVRCLEALGRESELRFHLGEVEKLSQRSSSAGLDYIHGVLCLDKNPPDYRTARASFEGILRGNPTAIMRARAKIRLATIYERVEHDYRTCRKIIDSIEPVADPMIQLAVEIWKGLLLREEGDLKGAEKSLRKVLAKVENAADGDWYYSISIKIILANLSLKQNHREEAATQYKELQSVLTSRGDHLFTQHLRNLESRLRAREKDESVLIQIEECGVRFTFGDLERQVMLPRQSNINRLLELFSANEIQTKENIVSHLYEREYNDRRDDKLVYYHIHALRKFLEKNGLTNKAVIKRGEGYSFQPKVIRGGKNEAYNS